MFDSIKSLGKATIGVVVETPLAIATDLATLGGAITDKDEPYTATALKKVVENVKDATEPDKT